MEAKIGCGVKGGRENWLWIRGRRPRNETKAQQIPRKYRRHTLHRSSSDLAPLREGNLNPGQLLGLVAPAMESV